MANTPITSGPPAPKKTVSLEDRIVANPTGFAQGLLVGAAVLGVLALWQFYRVVQKEGALLPVAAWCAGLALVCAFGAVYLRLASQGPGGSELRGRLRLLILGLG